MVLEASEYDATDMASVAHSQGFRHLTFLSEQATSTALWAALQGPAAHLSAGDMLLLTYSGHGGQLPDKNQDEGDGWDETWCLYDRQLIDDELFAALTRLRQGVRVAVVSDSCHSGTVARLNAVRNSNVRIEAEERAKALPTERAFEIYDRHRSLYNELQDSYPSDMRANLRCSVILLAACQDWENSYDGRRNGLYTRALKNVWDGGTFTGNYLEFHSAICTSSVLDQRQHPNYMKAGVPNPSFELERPFSV